MTETHKGSHKKTMRAVMWEGKPFHMAVRDIPKPTVAKATDAIVRVTTAAICGTDLHIYHGILGGTEVPYSVGHEAIGIITDIGSAVDRFKIGDRVLIPGIPDQDELLVEPELLPTAYTAYGLGNVFGDLGGCQGKSELMSATLTPSGAAETP